MKLLTTTELVPLSNRQSGDACFCASNNFASRSRVRGFTLIELMISILILVILASVALPSFGAFQRNNRLDAAAQNLNSTIRLARSEAISKNSLVKIEIDTAKTITLCRVASIADTCPAVTDEDTFRTAELDFTGVDIESPDVNLANGFAFDARGRLVGGGSLDIGVCDDRGDAEGKLVRVNAVGQSSLAEIADVSGAACS